MARNFQNFSGNRNNKHLHPISREFVVLNFPSYVVSTIREGEPVVSGIVANCDRDKTACFLETALANRDDKIYLNVWKRNEINWRLRGTLSRNEAVG